MLRGDYQVRCVARHISQGYGQAEDGRLTDLKSLRQLHDDVRSVEAAHASDIATALDRQVNSGRLNA